MEVRKSAWKAIEDPEQGLFDGLLIIRVKLQVNSLWVS